ncbi:MAG: hypothetical protein IJ326_07655 [Lachnospiraceae bacterium]|nr:hypothetical protein [Lachnospiraceae bacterium]
MKNKGKQWWWYLLFPHWFIKLILVLVSAVLLVYSLGYQDANPIIAYSSYLLSFYTLVIVCLRVPAVIKKIKRILKANKYSGRYLEDPLLRAKVSLYGSGGINLIYAAFYLAAGIYYRSVWTGAMAVYYEVLSLIRIGLIRRDRKGQAMESGERRGFELKSSRFCGKLMFLLHIVMTGLVIQMVWKNKYYDYPGVMIYAQAAYAFFCFGMAIKNIIKYRKMERPILSAAKVVSLSCALMSIFALQTAMLMQFGAEQAEFMQLMNMLTGGAVCFGEFVLAIWLVHITNKEIKKLDMRKEALEVE